MSSCEHYSLGIDDPQVHGRTLKVNVYCQDCDAHEEMEFDLNL